MKNLTCFLASFLLLLSGVCYAEPVLDVKTSEPGDGFAIGIPKNWNEKVYDSERGMTYAYWDQTGDAITITVREPSSLKQVLMAIRDGKFSQGQLKKLQKVFSENAPAKRDVYLGIEVISNEKALMQIYLYRHEAVGHVHFLVNTQFDLIKNNKQYQISFSPSRSKSEKDAMTKYKQAYKNTFHPIIKTFFLK